jgi:hypothetical protein
MKKALAYWLLAAALATLAAGMVTGCKKSGGSASTPESDVYFVGWDSIWAVYWKNGVETVLGPGQGAGITVSGSDVYVGGEASKTKILAAVWKNGVEQDLADSTSAAYIPLVVGSDVYVPGLVVKDNPQDYAVYWKNGQRVDVDSGIYDVATSMAVSGSDIYMVGNVSGMNDTACVWNNGQRLADASTFNNGVYNQILIAGGNIYVVGRQGYFVNFASQYTQLPDAVFSNYMFLNGSDIYVAGTRQDGQGNTWAAYWKNGVLDTLPNYPNTLQSYATGIAVAGSDVYVTGSAYLGSVFYGVYWKNGVEETLTRQGSVNGVALGN